ncbi:MAG: hypothetical protein KDI82_08935 [Gammaproteobacteria bacterium]|nr:hypothetical protein [Gammaproteobacteria bacterium]
MHDGTDVERKDTPIIIDVEASGFGRGSYPIEIGIVLADASRHCFLIAPARRWTHWDPDAEQVHGISRELLVRHGRSVQDVAWRLNQLLRNRTAYSDAWAFDMSWVGKLFDAAGIEQTFRIADIADLIDAGQLERWQATKDAVTESLGLQRHRASGDARILQETWRTFRSQVAATS